MGSKKKHERSKSSKKHKHKKHKKKKEKTRVSDISDAHESSEFEATASTQEALEQYDRILLALESKDMKDDVPEKAEAATDFDVSSNLCSSAQSELNMKDANASLLEQRDILNKSVKRPCSEEESSFSKESMQLQSGNDLQSKGGQLQEKSQSRSRSSSKDDQAKNKRHRSRSKSHQSKSRGHQSRSRGHQSRSRGRRSRSRDRQSRSRDHQSRSRTHQSRSRTHQPRNKHRNRGRQSRSRDRRSKSRDHQHLRRRHYRSSSRSLSQGRSRSYEQKRRERRRRRSGSSSSSGTSRSYSPKRRRKIVVEKVEAPQGSLESFTTLCQKLVKQVQDLPVVNFPVDDDNTVTQQQPIRAPFNVGTPHTQDLVLHNNAWKTSMQVMTEKTMTSSVTEIFPCSSGTEHHTKEVQGMLVGTFETPAPPQESVDIGALSQRRLQLQQQLQTNPMDIQAYSSYLQVEQQIAEWSNTQKVPGQFTGQKKVTSGLTGKDLHATGRQAWVKKDMFARLDPVRSDFGLKMMKKMGWVEGTPLGKTGVGHIVPPVLNFQVDRKGLVSEIDSVKVAPPPNAIKSTGRNIPSMFKGKHPVSALQELAAKKQWVVSYDEATIPGKLGFRFKITLPMGTFQPEEVSATKKQAKVHAALNCLVAIGALPPDEAKSILESQS